MHDEELNRLFQAARQHTPDTARAEYAFETRLLARLRAERARPAAWPWAAVAARLLPVFAAIVLALGAWNLASPRLEFHEAIGEPVEAGLLVTLLTGDQP